MAAAFLFAVGASFCGLALTGAGRGLLTTELTFGSAAFWIALLGLVSVCAPRAFAEERESGTLELLLTAPVRDGEVVLSKYASLLFWLGLLCLLAAAPPWLLRALYRNWSGFDAGAWVAGAVQMGLAVSVVTAAGLLASLLFRGQAAAAVVTFLAGGALIFGAGVRPWLGFEGQGAFVRAIEPRLALELFASGILDSRWIVLCVSSAAVVLFAAVRFLEWARFRQWKEGLNALLSVALAAVLAAMANGISSRHFARWDCSSWRAQGLAGRTVEILRAVKAPVGITLVGPASDRRVREARRLLERGMDVCRFLTVVHVDPQVDLAKTRELAQAFGLREADVMVVESRGRHTVLPLKEAGPAPGAAPGGPEGLQDGARGLEGAIASAVYALTRETVPGVGFLAGQGERSVEDFADYSGYSEIASLIRRRQAAVGTCSLEGGSNDCSVMVVAGPARSLTAWEVGKLREQLARGVRLLFLLDAGRETGVEPLLAEWGLKVGNDRIVEAAGTSIAPESKWRTASRGLGEVHASTYGRHPIAAGLEGLVTTFYLPRSVEPIRGEESGKNLTDIADRPRATALVLSSAASWADTDFVESPPRFSEGLDRRGPISMAACVEKGASSPIAMDLKPVRLVVFGDSQFAANRCITEGNLRLFMNALEWLLDEEHPLAPGARRPGVFDLTLSPAGKGMTVGAVLAGLPGLMALTGVVVLLLRRDRRTVKGGSPSERDAK